MQWLVDQDVVNTQPLKEKVPKPYWVVLEERRREQFHAEELKKWCAFKAMESKKPRRKSAPPENNEPQPKEATHRISKRININGSSYTIDATYDIDNIGIPCNLDCFIYGPIGQMNISFELQDRDIPSEDKIMDVAEELVNTMGLNPITKSVDTILDHYSLSVVWSSRTTARCVNAILANRSDGSQADVTDFINLNFCMESTKRYREIIKQSPAYQKAILNASCCGSPLPFNESVYAYDKIDAPVFPENVIEWTYSDRFVDTTGYVLKLIAEERLCDNKYPYYSIVNAQIIDSETGSVHYSVDYRKCYETGEYWWCVNKSSGREEIWKDFMSHVLKMPTSRELKAIADTRSWLPSTMYFEASLMNWFRNGN